MTISCALCLAALAWSPPADGPLRVDLNPANGRGDVATPWIENWAFEPAHPSRAFGRLTATLRSSEPLEIRWYKPLLASGATLGSDGVAATGVLELVIEGLSPGRHTLTTWHNRLTPGDAPICDVFVDGRPLARGVVPTTRSADDARSGSAFVEFDAGAEPVIVSIRANGGDREVILNGFEIDASDPTRRAIHPAPADHDDHAEADDGSAVLSWSSRRPAAKHDVYVGPDRAEVMAANHDSPVYRGIVSEPQYRAAAPSTERPMYWRIDEIDDEGKTTRGDVWTFRPRHLAFPGAEGYGRFARGGRGGKVIEVTNLDDDGTGSLRAAVAADGPRTVVFRVSGVIRLRSPLTVTHSYLTIAGETAPGDGVCLRGYPFGTASSTSDVIVRFLRVRPGDESGKSIDGMGLGGAHSIFDHCSISWSIDEGLDSRTAASSTFQRCLISEALDDSYQRHPHAFAASIGGKMVSYHHNLLAHCTGRVWSLAGGYDNAVKFAGHLDIRNNVVYNWRHRTTDGGAKRVNFVANYYKPGPATRVFHLLKADVGAPADRQVYFLAGNVMEGRPEYDADNWKGVVLNGEAPLDEVRAPAELFPSFVRTTSAKDAYADVLADVGATLPRQDPIDRRVIREVRTGTFTHRGTKGGLPGIIDAPTDLGPDPWPAYATRDVTPDADHDGLPDAWERTHALNPNSPPGDFTDPNADPDGDGYTLLEDYLHDLACPKATGDDTAR